MTEVWTIFETWSVYTSMDIGDNVLLTGRLGENNKEMIEKSNIYWNILESENVIYNINKQTWVIEEFEYKKIDFSPNKKHYVLYTKDGEVIVDWQKKMSHSFENVEDLKINDDGQYGYLWQENWQVSIIRNGQTIYQFQKNQNYTDEQYDLSFSDDFNHFMLQKRFNEGQIYYNYLDWVYIDDNTSYNTEIISWIARKDMIQQGLTPNNTTVINYQKWELHYSENSKIHKEGLLESLELRRVLPHDQFLEKAWQIRQKLEAGQQIKKNEKIFIIQNYWYNGPEDRLVLDENIENFCLQLLLNNTDLIFDEYIALQTKINSVMIVFSQAIKNDDQIIIDNMVKTIKSKWLLEDILPAIKYMAGLSTNEIVTDNWMKIYREMTKLDEAKDW